MLIILFYKSNDTNNDTNKNLDNFILWFKQLNSNESTN